MYFVCKYGEETTLAYYNIDTDEYFQIEYIDLSKNFFHIMDREDIRVYCIYRDKNGKLCLQK